MRVAVVRPYGERIRKRMFSAIEAAGLEIRSDDILPAHSPDRVVLEQIGTRTDHVLLVPFHAQRDLEGCWTNGFQLLGLLERIEPTFPWIVLMPVSRFGAAGAHLTLSSSNGDGPSSKVREKVLLIDEEGLDDPDLPGRIRRHVEQSGSPEGSSAK
ncbi:MAG: hypothetical protein K8J08_06330 [Thermoanaerobaculia bacterium]|nr:hypothetical protein [Thermoanaerobaculia bacterium]